MIKIYQDNDAKYPWYHLFIKPQNKMKEILNSNTRFVVPGITIFAGTVISIANMLRLETNSFELIEGLGLSLVFGGVILYSLLVFISWMVKYTGKWVGGVGTHERIICALSWSFTPLIISALLKISILALLIAYTDINIADSVTLKYLNVIEEGLIVLHLILSIIYLSIAQEISIFKSIINYVLSWVVFISAFALIIIMFRVIL